MPNQSPKYVCANCGKEKPRERLIGYCVCGSALYCTDDYYRQRHKETDEVGKEELEKRQETWRDRPPML